MGHIKHKLVLLTSVVGLLLIGAFAWPGLPFKSAGELLAQESVVHVLYFYSVDCTHCKAIEADVLEPLKAQHGTQLDLMMLEIGTPANYELLIRAEEQFEVAAADRGLPTIVLGDTMLIGEDDARAQLTDLVADGLTQGGIPLPDLAGLDEAVPSDGLTGDSGENSDDACAADDADVCAPAEPVWAAYFYQVGCQECSRAEADIQYIRAKYPHFTVEEFNIYDDAALADWMAQRSVPLPESLVLVTVNVFAQQTVDTRTSVRSTTQIRRVAIVGLRPRQCAVLAGEPLSTVAASLALAPSQLGRPRRRR